MNGVELFEFETRIDDLALLIGLPGNSDEFSADVALRKRAPTDGRGDFATNQGDGSHTVVAVNSLLETARLAGIPEFRIRAATLDALDDVATSGAKVIVVLAHWRGATVSMRDLSENAYGFARSQIANNSTSVLRHLSSFLAVRGIHEDAIPPGRFADILSDFIKSFDHPGQDDSRTVVRDALDTALGDVLAPGNAVEFRDAVHKPALLATTLPPDWSGICDLAVCHSMALAREMRAGRDDRRMITNRKPKYLDRAVAELREAFLCLAQKPQPYIKLRSEISSVYGEMILEA